MSPDDPRHGTTAGYDAHGRAGQRPCADCRSAAAAYEYRRRIDEYRGKRRTLPAIGTARRVQALVALGYTFGQIGAAAGFGHDWAAKLAHRADGYVRADTAVLVDRVYRGWCMTPPPQTNRTERWSVSYARTVAAKAGWVPPLAWDDIDDPEALPLLDAAGDDDIDEVVVQRIFSGDGNVTATPAERREVCRRWVEAGRSLNELGRITGWMVSRYYKLRDEEAVSA